MSDPDTVTLELSTREIRALWRSASMFDGAFKEALGRCECEEPRAIDSGLAKLELALMLAGQEIS